MYEDVVSFAYSTELEYQLLKEIEYFEDEGGASFKA